MKENAKDYTREDFAEFRERASNRITASFLGFKNSENITYRGILDSVKSERLSYEAALTKYNEALKNLKSKVSFKTLQAEYAQDDYVPGYVIGYTYTNKTKDTIDAFEADLKVYDKLNNQVFHGYFKFRVPIIPGKENRDVKAFYLGSDDDADILKNTPYDKLRFEWLPTQIIFAGGSSMKEPSEPYKPE